MTMLLSLIAFLASAAGAVVAIQSGTHHAGILLCCPALAAGIVAFLEGSDGMGWLAALCGMVVVAGVAAGLSNRRSAAAVACVLAGPGLLLATWFGLDAAAGSFPAESRGPLAIFILAIAAAGSIEIGAVVGALGRAVRTRAT